MLSKKIILTLLISSVSSNCLAVENSSVLSSPPESKILLENSNPPLLMQREQVDQSSVARLNYAYNMVRNTCCHKSHTYKLNYCEPLVHKDDPNKKNQSDFQHKKPEAMTVPLRDWTLFVGGIGDLNKIAKEKLNKGHGAIIELTDCSTQQKRQVNINIDETLNTFYITPVLPKENKLASSDSKDREDVVPITQQEIEVEREKRVGEEKKDASIHLEESVFVNQQNLTNSKQNQEIFNLFEELKANNLKIIDDIKLNNPSGGQSIAPSTIFVVPDKIPLSNNQSNNSANIFTTLKAQNSRQIHSRQEYNVLVINNPEESNKYTEKDSNGNIKNAKESNKYTEKDSNGNKINNVKNKSGNNEIVGVLVVAAITSSFFGVKYLLNKYFGKQDAANHKKDGKI